MKDWCIKAAVEFSVAVEIELTQSSSPLPPQVIRGLLKFWPKTCSQKEVRFVSLCRSCTPALSVCVMTVCFLCRCAGDVSRGAGGNPGRHRANAVRQDPGAALQTDLQMCLQPTLPGQWPSNSDDLSGLKALIEKEIVDSRYHVILRHSARCMYVCVCPRLQSELSTTGTTSISWVWSRRTPASSCPSCSPACTGSPKSTGTREWR